MAMRGNYPEGFREQAVAKAFARSGEQTLVSIAEGLNITLGTLRSWMKIASRDPKKLPTKAKRAADFTLAERLLALQESHGLEEESLNAWCRERGIFAHDLAQWRSAFCDTDLTTSGREESEELRQLRFTNAQLQRDLNRKEKALAEAAALLVLQKKYRALWAAEDV
jgi:transposase-like protein